jgi:hypothetical protein
MHQRSHFPDKDPDQYLNLDPDPDHDQDMEPEQDPDPDPDPDPDLGQGLGRTQNVRLCIRRFPERFNGRQLYVVVTCEPLEIRGWSGQLSGAVDDPGPGQEQASVVHPLELAAVDVPAAVDVDNLSQQGEKAFAFNLFDLDSLFHFVSSLVLVLLVLLCVVF